MLCQTSRGLCTCSWQAIQDSGELHKMSRTHIHFATQPHLLRANKWANVLLRLRLQVWLLC